MSDCFYRLLTVNETERKIVLYEPVSFVESKHSDHNPCLPNASIHNQPTQTLLFTALWMWSLGGDKESYFTEWRRKWCVLTYVYYITDFLLTVELLFVPVDLFCYCSSEIREKRLIVCVSKCYSFYLKESIKNLLSA